MERRRKYKRHHLQTMHKLVPPVVRQLSLLLAVTGFFVVLDFAECIMTFPEERGVYSLFPDEDLKTGRKRLRFDEETTIRNYREGRDYLVRSYPMLPHDRLHRPVDFGGGGGGREGNRQVYDDFRDRDRHGRVYFDDSFRSSRFDFHRLSSRPRPIERPLSPVVFETSRRPPHIHPFIPESFPPGPPAIGQSKLPPGATGRVSGEDVPTRIHIFNPDSDSFGHPRNAGGGEDGGGNDGPSSSERTKGPPSNFVETGPPGPESFLNHEEFLEYQKKIAFSRFHEQDAGSNSGGGGKKVLFESKEPFEIDRLAPSDKSGENTGKVVTTKVPLEQTYEKPSLIPITVTTAQQQRLHERHQVLIQDQRQHQRYQQQQSVQGQKTRTSETPKFSQQHPPTNDGEEERDSGGGEVESDTVNGKGEEVESENGKSEVTQLPPTHIAKSGRSHYHKETSSSGGGAAAATNSFSVSDHGSGASGGSSKKFTPSISYNEDRGGTGFKLPTTAVTFSGDSSPNLNGFAPNVPFHLIGAEQPRPISLERPRQHHEQQQRIAPHHYQPTVQSTTPSTTTTSTTTTIRTIPVTSTIQTTTSRSKGEKSGFRAAQEISKASFGSSASPFSVISGPPALVSDEKSGNNNGIGGSTTSSPASPILHATAGERINSETHSKVAITKQQELKRLQKQRQLSSSVHQQVTSPPHTGLLPEFSLGDSSASSDSSEHSDNPGTNLYHNSLLDIDGDMVTLHPSSDTLSSPTPTQVDQSVETMQNTLPPTTMQSLHESSSSEENSIDTVESSEHSNTRDTQNPFISQITQTHNENDTHHETMPHNSSSSPEHTIIEQSPVVSLGDDETKTEIDKKPGLFDGTRAVEIANGIKQGEFLLEGYMINDEDAKDGDGSSLASRRSSDPDYKSDEDSSHYQVNRRLYDYPQENLPIIDEPNTSRLHAPPDDSYGPPVSQLPGTTAPDLEQNIIPFDEHSSLKNPFPDDTPTGSGSSDDSHVTTSQQHNTDTSSDDDVTGNEDTSSSIEPNILEENVHGLTDSPATVSDHGVIDAVIETEPTFTTPPELRRTRFTEINENNFASPTNPYYPDENSLFPYFNSFGNRINSTNQPFSGISSSGSISGVIRDDDDETFSFSGSGEGPRAGGDENGAFENDVFSRVEKSGHSSSSSSSSHDSLGIRKTNSKMFRLRIMTANGDFIDGSERNYPNSISVPVAATIRYGHEGSASPTGSANANYEVNNSLPGKLEDDHESSSKNAEPLYLESSETLMNKTYYLDGNYNSIQSSRKSSSKSQSNQLKSSNFIKVTRIKATPGSSSKETSEKTSSTILARRTSKPAVIVSTTAAGARPRVVGSVVEAGPAWPGLVSNFLRTNLSPQQLQQHILSNPRVFTATATVRPRGNSGNNPSPLAPTSGQVEQISRDQVQKQLEQTSHHHHRKQSPHTPPPPPQQLHQEPPPTATAIPTQFQLQQIRIPSMTSTIRSTTDVTTIDTQRSANQHPKVTTNHPRSLNNSSIVFRSNGGANGNKNTGKQASPKVHTNKHVDQKQSHTNNSNHSGNNSTNGSGITDRRLYSSEEDSSSAQINGNSSTGIVSLVHAHISHCPKLHSPTEVICDVHIREGHGVANPQLTVGWRRKFYNSTQPDVLLALNKTPPSGEQGRFDPHHSIVEVEPGNNERLEDFHDKFNVTLAPGISPMLRSVLLIRSVTAPDCGTYQCEVNDGINVLHSETLLFLCH